MGSLPLSFGSKPLPLRWILPLVQLLLCAIALIPVHQRLQTDLSIIWNDITGGYTAAPQPAAAISKQVKPPADNALFPSASDPDKAVLQIPMALNIPALMLQVPWVLIDPDENIWRPRGLLLPDWNALFLPLAGLVFWWSAGRGLEALFASTKRRVDPYVTWIEAIGAFIMLMIGVIVIAGVVTSNSSDEHSLRAGAAGFALWSGLSIPVLLAKGLQLREISSLKF